MRKHLFHAVSDEAVSMLTDESKHPIFPKLDDQELRLRINREFPEHGVSPIDSIQLLIKSTERALVHTKNPRYFGYVIGGASDVSIAADWLTSVWDQCGHVFNTSVASALIEEVVSEWLLKLLSLPDESSIGYVSGAQMANFTALLAARNWVLKEADWDVVENGIQGAPKLTVFCADCCHGTILSSLQMIGLGRRNIRFIPTDNQGRMQTAVLEDALISCSGPKIICAQAGNVNTGAFDFFDTISEMTQRHRAWLHIDGAFGLWARASVKYRTLCQGLDKADSWSVDAHKWLNVPYDSGLVIIRNEEAHRSIKNTRCAYAGAEELSRRDGSVYTPENSRRARAFVLYAALNNLGREGVCRIVEQGCECATLFAEEFGRIPEAKVVNDIVLNQVLIRLEKEGVEDLESFHDQIAEQIQNDGTCWLGTSIWKGSKVLRISVSNSQTTRKDVLKSMESIRQIIERF